MNLKQMKNEMMLSQKTLVFSLLLVLCISILLFGGCSEKDDDDDTTTTTQASTPTFSPLAGTYDSNQNVSILTTTQGATIYYTTNGNDPSTSSNVYSNSIQVNSTTTIKAIAVKSGVLDSTISTAIYSINYSPVTNTNTITFIDIPVTGSTHAPFQMAISEVTTQQYVNFLNDALSQNLIQIGTASTTSWIVSDQNENSMIDLLGYRVIKDHNNDGIYELWEMENPLNRCMIQYDKVERKFSVVNPADVDWNIYFDSETYPNVVDEITDWAELQDFWPADAGSLEGKIKVSFYETDIHETDGSVKENITLVGHLDTEDCALPAHDEVKKWPASFISYYGAKAFADFYGYQLPSYQEYQWVGKGGYDERIYSTDDGTINRANNVYNGEPTRNGGKHKGHAQPVMKFAPNPYGLYDLGGSVTEWTRTDETEGSQYNCMAMGTGLKMTKIDGAWPRPADMCKISDCRLTEVIRGNDHFGFRVVKEKLN